VWTVRGIVAGGEHDHEAGPSGGNQEENPIVGPMDIIPYNTLEDRGLMYS